MSMGVLEQESKRRRRRNEIQQTILTTLAVGAVVLLAGGALAQGLVRSFFRGKSNRRPANIKRSLKTLLDGGYVFFKETPKGKKLEITDRGRKYLDFINADEFVMPKPKKWDKKFRLVIFDIKEERRGDRRKLRVFLKKIGFMRLQHSVWVYPYDCEEAVALLKAELHIGKDLLYIIADAIEYDTPLRKHFRLPFD